MTSASGYVSYLKVITGNAKGEIPAGTALNTPFALGANIDYTGDAVADIHEYADLDASTHKIATLLWTPVVSVADVYKRTTATGAWTKLTLTTDYTVDTTAGTVTLVNALASGNAIRVLYKYNNIKVPANQIPTVTVEMDGVALTAKAKKVQIFYSQMAA